MGHIDGPCEFVPLHLCSWTHRFDDPRGKQGEYRTLYCASSPLTCLREVLADLRPDTITLSELAELPGPNAKITSSIGKVRMRWRSQHALVKAEIASEGEVIDIEDIFIRRELEADHVGLLARHGMKHLDISEIRSDQRVVTKTMGLTLYERGYAGVNFRSNLDNNRCLALFEGRAQLIPLIQPLSLEADLDELITVCNEYGLTLCR